MRQSNLFKKIWVFYFYFLFGKLMFLGAILHLVFGLCGWWCLWRYFGGLTCWAYTKRISLCHQVVFLFSPFSLFLIVFDIEHNVRFRCGGRANWNFWGNLNLKRWGWIWLREDFECSGYTCPTLIMWNWFMWPMLIRDYF